MKIILLLITLFYISPINSYAKWIYTKNIDEMTSEASYTWATKEITNSKKSQLLIFRSSSINSIGLLITNNRIIDAINGDRVDILVRFDNKQPITYENIMVGNNYRIAFIWDEDRVKDFLNRIAESKEIKIQIAIYGDGYAIEKFNVSGLNLNEVNKLMFQK
jgi:hypothetical protein